MTEYYNAGVLIDMMSRMATLANMSETGLARYSNENEQIEIGSNGMPLFAIYQTDLYWAIGFYEDDPEDVVGDDRRPTFYAFKDRPLGELITVMVKNSLESIYFNMDGANLIDTLNFDDIMAHLGSDLFVPNYDLLDDIYTQHPHANMLLGVEVLMDPEAIDGLAIVVNPDDEAAVLAMVAADEADELSHELGMPVDVILPDTE